MRVSPREVAEQNLDHLPVPDGVRRVVEMRRPDGAEWHVDVGESESDDHARLIAEAMSEDNGGGWEFGMILDEVPEKELGT